MKASSAWPSCSSPRDSPHGNLSFPSASPLRPSGNLLRATIHAKRCCAEPRLGLGSTNYQHIISIEPGKRGGRPCIRHMRIAVADMLGGLAAGQSHQQILDDFLN